MVSENYILYPYKYIFKVRKNSDLECQRNSHLMLKLQNQNLQVQNIQLPL